MKVATFTCLLFAILTGCASHDRSATTHTTSSESARTNVLDLWRPPTVIVVRTTNHFVYIDGEVNRPGRQIWSAGLTLTNAIGLAGGFTEFARRSQLAVRHPDGAVEQFSYSEIRKGAKGDPMLREGDRVFVPRRFLW
jgi:polysaccharide export outer membrane protein